MKIFQAHRLISPKNARLVSPSPGEHAESET